MEQTRQRAEKVLALSMEHGFPMFQLLAMIVRGWCIACLGQPDEGIGQLQQGLTIWRSSGTEVGVPFMFTLLADACGKAGRPEEGLKHLVEAERARWKLGTSAFMKPKCIACGESCLAL
jgi:predicted ATPase